MLGFFQKRRDNKKISEALELIGKMLILEGFGAEEALSIAQHALNQVINDNSKDVPEPWPLAVMAMFQLKLKFAEVIREQEPNEQELEYFNSLIPILTRLVRDFIPNALETASVTDKQIVKIIGQNNEKEIS
jgi:hypothetical protein